MYLSSEPASLPEFALGRWLEHPSLHDHAVQLYAQDQALVQSLCEFVSKGIEHGDSSLVILNADHRAALETALEARGFDLAALARQDRYVALDAAETLASFMSDGMPDRERFLETVLPALDRAAAAGRSVRAFGEMVALLWLDDKPDAAIYLEELWHELSTRRAFTLLCGYPLRAFREGQEDKLLHVCRTHSKLFVDALGEPHSAASGPVIALAKALRASEERFRSFLQNLPGVVFRVAGTAPHRFEFVSQGAERMLGVGTQHLRTAEDCRPFVVDQDWLRAQATIAEAMTSSEPFEVELRVQPRNGTLRKVMCRGRVQRDQRGTYVEGHAVDVTHLREAQAAEKARLALETEYRAKEAYLQKEREARQQAEAALREAEEARQEEARLTAELELQQEQLKATIERLRESNDELLEISSRLREEQERSAAITQNLRAAARITATVARSSDPAEIAELLVNWVGSLGCETCAIWLSDPDHRRMRVAAERGFPVDRPQGMESEFDVSLNPSKVGWVARVKNPYVGPILSEDPQFEQAWSRAYGFQAAAVLPLVGRGRVRGVMALFFPHEIPPGTEEVLATLSAVYASVLDGFDKSN